jgi:sulfoacetaldehyde dehydrogenase
MRTMRSHKDNVDDVHEMYQRARRAFEEIEFWPQEKADEMALAAGWEWQKNETAEALARLAVKESGIGVYEDKVAKIKHKTRGSLWDMRGVKTCGVVTEDRERGLTIFAKPIGVIANVVPCTNPESTICALGVNILKTRNAMIVSPHPRTRGSSYLTVEHGRKALRRIGAPEDLMQCISNPSREKALELMKACDFTIATGGTALVRAVYAAAKPCQTVGAGNVVSIVDDTADVASTASKIVLSKIANNSASCSSENALAIHDSIYGEMMSALREEGGYLCSSEERERLRKVMWPDGVHLNGEIVARPARSLAKMAAIEVPDGTRFLMVLGEHVGPQDRYSGEKLSPVLTVWRWSDFDDVLDHTARILKFSGEGHSVSIHSTDRGRQMETAMRMRVGRVNCNMPHAMANSGSWFNGQPFTDSLGCGTWAGNMTTDNINYRHFLNYTWLSVPIKEHVPSDEEIFGDYPRKWGED